MVVKGAGVQPERDASYACEEFAHRRVLLVHNRYQHAGGEDQVFESETALLSRYGHEVAVFELHNDAIKDMSPVVVAAKTLWNHGTYRQLRAKIQEFRPAVVHFHNTFPLVSASAYYGVREEGITAVQTLHNYRLLCPCAVLYRSGSVCELCMGKLVAWPAVRFRCYRDSRAATATVTAMLSAHKLLRTWNRKVDLYIALTKFARDKFIEGGLPPEKIAIKPNFVYPDPGIGAGRGGFALFAGRLTEEKGLRTLLDAWRIVGSRLPLKIAGEGPLQGLVAREAIGMPSVEFLGRLPRKDVLALMREAALLIFPSTWYEGFGLTIVEAFACGLPVVASDLGSIASLVEEGQNGLKFVPGNAEELATKVVWAATNDGRLAQMRAGARGSFEDKYTAEANYTKLCNIYQSASVMS